MVTTIKINRRSSVILLAVLIHQATAASAPTSPSIGSSFDIFRNLLASPRDLQASASSGYSSYSDCDCTKYDLLGVVAGGAALAALVLYELLQQAAAARSLDEWIPPLSPFVADAMLSLLPRKEELADTAVSTTCKLTNMLEAGQLGLGGLMTSVGARSGYKDDSADCDCFRAVAGALAGFAALAALAAFALQQAVAAAAARSFAGFSLSHDADGDSLHFMLRFLETLADNDDPCMPYRVCKISEEASLHSTRLYSSVRLASLPVSWFLSSSSTSAYSFNDYCDVISDVSRCDVTFRRCDRRQKYLYESRVP